MNRFQMTLQTGMTIMISRRSLAGNSTGKAIPRRELAKEKQENPKRTTPKMILREVTLAKEKKWTLRKVKERKANLRRMKEKQGEVEVRKECRKEKKKWSRIK